MNSHHPLPLSFAILLCVASVGRAQDIVPDVQLPAPRDQRNMLFADIYVDMSRMEVEQLLHKNFTLVKATDEMVRYRVDRDGRKGDLTIRFRNDSAWSSAFTMEGTRQHRDEIRSVFDKFNGAPLPGGRIVRKTETQIIEQHATSDGRPMRIVAKLVSPTKLTMELGLEPAPKSTTRRKK